MFIFTWLVPIPCYTQDPWTTLGPSILLSTSSQCWDFCCRSEWSGCEAWWWSRLPGFNATLCSCDKAEVRFPSSSPNSTELMIGQENSYRIHWQTVINGSCVLNVNSNGKGASYRPYSAAPQEMMREWTWTFLTWRRIWSLVYLRPGCVASCLECLLYSHFVRLKTALNSLWTMTGLFDSVSSGIARCFQQHSERKVNDVIHT